VQPKSFTDRLTFFPSHFLQTLFPNMPVFQETSNAARDLRILPSRAPPLPRLSPEPGFESSAEEKREVVVIGVSIMTRTAVKFSLTLR
jgi:hypothetical protein